MRIVRFLAFLSSASSQTDLFLLPLGSVSATHPLVALGFPQAAELLKGKTLPADSTF
jgi:hypothetical protein